MRYKASVLVVGLAFLVPAVAQATSVRALDFKTLADKADVIAHGRVTALTSQWAASGADGIATIVTVAVTGYLKGDLGAQIVFLVPGGQIGRWRMVRVGAPVFHEGEEIVVFLASSSSAAFPRIVGFNQGVLRVRVDPVSEARTVASPVLAGESTTATPLVRGDPSRKPVPLEQFEARVRSVLEELRSERPVNGKRNGSAVRRVR